MQCKIPAPEETGIKVLAFDQGGIYIGVDYRKTVSAFNKLGAVNAQMLYTQAEQTSIVDDFERGIISSIEFYDYLRKNLEGLQEDADDRDLYLSWNAMLTGVIPGVLEFIKDLRKLGYITIVVSNADEIHQAGVEEQLKEEGSWDLFNQDAFDLHYISYRFGYNKPYIDIFQAVTEDLKKRLSFDITPEEIMFFDDSNKHIVGRRESEGAIRAGWRGVLVESNLPVKDFARQVQINLQLLTGSRSR